MRNGERKCRYLNCSEQTRTYFDDKRAYHFRRNPVTLCWEPDDLGGHLVKNDEVWYADVDKDVFDKLEFVFLSLFGIVGLI